MPSFPAVSLAQVFSLVGPAFTIALLGAIESLLSAVVADGMAGTRHDSNQELIGQGVANILAPLFGGFAATGAIARTATNIRNGATGPMAALVHSAFLVLVILLLAPIASAIPLCCLSAILFVVAWNMSEAGHVVRLLRRAPRPDAAVLLLTFLLTVFVDLVVAVNVGVIVAALLFMRRSADAVNVELQSASPEDPAATVRSGSSSVLVYSIDGPLFFGAADKFERAVLSVRPQARVLVLRLGKVPFIDATGISAIEEMIADFRRRGAAVLLTELRPNVRYKLERSGVIDALGSGNVLEDLEAALARANACAGARPDAEARFSGMADAGRSASSKSSGAP
jgi:SulP family sulfate permease